jgi:ankyrin repeat protein
MGNFDIVTYLIAIGEDISVRDSRGYEPRDEALRENRDDVFELLNSV